MRIRILAGYLAHIILALAYFGVSGALADQVFNDDVIVNGGDSAGLCVGLDCSNGEVFGDDSIRLKEPNLRIHFQDTSVGAFPTNDFRIEINDTAPGGTNHFSIVDSTAGQTLLRLCAVNDTTCTTIIPNAVTDNDLLTSALATNAVSTATIAANTGNVATNTTNIATNRDWINSIKTQTANINNRLYKAEKRVKQNKSGVAVAIALGGGAQPMPGQSVALSFDFGHFEGASAGGVSATARINEFFSVHGGVGAGLRDGAVGGRVGIGVGW